MLSNALPACLGLILAAVATGCASPAGSGATNRNDYAREIRRELIEKIMPYWYDTTVDWKEGGYLLADDAVRKAPPASEKQLVTQSRMIWGFSHAHRKGLGDGKRDYLKAAQNGYRFLIDHMKDPQQGGYFWATDVHGKPVNERKIVYGEAFVIYGLVEYYRASGKKEALDRAMEQFRVLQARAYDATNGGWIEHFDRDWKPMLKPVPEAIVEVGGFKSANTHLHLMEAFAELYDATRDPEVRKAVEESLKINMRYFYPPDPGKSCFHRQLDWSPVTLPSSAGLSYGHNVEFAWLMIRAEEVLRRKPSWTHFNAHIDHALKYGYDHQRGGLYSRGSDDQPATDTDKVWWVQSEMLAALTDGLQNKPNAEWSDALDSLLKWIQTKQADPKDGIWIDTLTADGKVKSGGKAHNWKANYHDVRALVKFVEAFGETPAAAVK
jgi:mannobiose 2-epimerase